MYKLAYSSILNQLSRHYLFQMRNVFLKSDSSHCVSIAGAVLSATQSLLTLTLNIFQFTEAILSKFDVKIQLLMTVF